MLSDLLPSPDMHTDWQSFARALISAIGQIEAGADFGTIQHVVSTTPVSPGNLPPLPAGYAPVWLNGADTLLYLGNPAYDPPTAPNIVYIDTAKLADAAVAVNKLQDGAVTSAKILNATIGSADIGNAQILSALIADAAIVNAKIGDLAVNNAKIANAAVDSAKIANLAVGTAHIQNAAIGNAQIGNLAVSTAQIQDGAILNAKIGNTIQSSSWNPTTKAGWMIDKTGLIQGAGIAIYDGAGNLVFGSGGTVAWSAITGYTPGPTANRVYLARFELGTYAWGVFNGSGLNTIYQAGEWLNKRFLKLAPQFTANGQQISVRSATQTTSNIRLTANERVSISYRLEVQGKPQWGIACRLHTFDAAGTLLGSHVVGTDIAAIGGTGDIVYGTLYQSFVTVEATAAYGYLEWYVFNNTGGANALDANNFFIAVIEPSLTGATANQTGHSAFTPGPNGFVEQFTSGNISTFIANAAIQQAQIANLAVGTAQIQDLAVTSAKIVSLDAGKINAASLSAITATIGLLRTATSGSRLEIESNQIRVYYASGNLALRMGIW